MRDVPTFLIEHRELIRGLGAQELPKWPRNYDAVAGSPMDRLRRRFPDKKITRADLIDLYRSWNDPVLALVATMVWGLIDTTKKKRLQSLLTLPEEELKRRLAVIRELVRSGKSDEAFRRCSVDASTLLPGVGPSYFTKVFQFIGQVEPVLKPAPLILDKWTGSGFYALSRQVPTIGCFAKFYYLAPLKKGDAALFSRHEDRSLELYSLFNRWMNYWADQLGVAATKLEQFIFGRSFKLDRTSDNPRRQLLLLAAREGPS